VIRRTVTFLALLWLCVAPAESRAEILKDTVTGRRLECTIADMTVGGKMLVVLPSGRPRFLDLKRYAFADKTAGHMLKPTQPAVVFTFRLRADFGTSPYAAPHYANALRACLNRAAAANAAAVIISIDCSRGPVDPAMKMADMLAKEQRVLTVACVGAGNGAAYSAAALIALGCDVIAMRTHAVIGASAPVNADGQNLAADARAKWVSALSGKFRALARRRRRPVPLAIGMVDTSLEVVELARKGDEKFKALGPREERPDDALRVWSQRGALLTLTGQEAKATGFADHIYSSSADLFKKLQLGEKPRAVAADGAIDKLHKKLAGLKKKFAKAHALSMKRVGEVQSLNDKLAIATEEQTSLHSALIESERAMSRQRSLVDATRDDAEHFETYQTSLRRLTIQRSRKARELARARRKVRHTMEERDETRDKAQKLIDKALSVARENDRAFAGTLRPQIVEFQAARKLLYTAPTSTVVRRTYGN
jgi:hypothetical protein